MNVSSLRTRWAAVGAAVAITLGAGGVSMTSALTDSGEKPIYVPIEPCRLLDTRAAQAIERNTPLGPDEQYTRSGWGSQGNCTLPTGTTGLALNVTAVGPTMATYLAFYPADAASVPTASNLNPTPGQPPTPNAVNVDLDAAGEFKIYNLQGNVNVIVDVVGYYDDHNHDDRYVAKAQSMIIPPSQFHAVNPSIEVTVGNIYGTYISGGGPATESLRAPLALPIGSTITRITYHYIDDSAESLSLDIVRTSLSSNSQGFVSGLGIDTAGASTNPRSTAIDVNFVVEAGVELAIGAFNTNWTVVGQGLTVKGVQIDYVAP